MRSLLALLFSLPLLLGAPALVDAAGKDKGKAKAGQVPTVSKGKNKGKSGDVTTDRLLGTVISAVERALIGDYIKKAKVKHNGLPPGLAKRQHSEHRSVRPRHPPRRPAALPRRQRAATVRLPPVHVPRPAGGAATRSGLPAPSPRLGRGGCASGRARSPDRADRNGSGSDRSCWS